jgi:hypothetical protein
MLSARTATAAVLALCAFAVCATYVAAANPALAPFLGLWVKNDRSAVEVRHINITASADDDNTITGTYLDGPLAGKITWNCTLCGDFMSGTGTYANFNDDMSMWCPAPYSLILTADTNVILVAYGRTTQDNPCGFYAGDSATYYRAQPCLGKF